jgi:hypothetical protein
MSLQLAPALREALDATDPDLRPAAQAIGIAVAAQLQPLRPALTRSDGDAATADVEIVVLDLDPEGPPDGLTIASCEAAHDAYVRARGAPSATSLGALAIARLLVWAQRAAILGRAPTILWIGPSQRRPDGLDGIEIHSTCSGRVAGVRRTAKAVAVLRRPDAEPGD